MMLRCRSARVYLTNSSSRSAKAATSTLPRSFALPLVHDPEAYTQPMRDINREIGDAIKSALISQNKTTQELAREMGVERSQIDRLASGLEGTVPRPLLEVLDALGLELLVHPKEQKEQTLSSMLQDNARS